MKKLGFLVLSLVTLFPTAAFANDNEEGDKTCNNCQDNRGFRFTDSPVKDSFNLILCLPGSTCNFNQPEE